ncbi:MAG: PBP1A family penicillin-binding protein [Alphaproteobacteria bacterium]|nr:PBP1A family penicillin-binding protein [Alphaproteobacteria bacterium]
MKKFGAFLSFLKKSTILLLRGAFWAAVVLVILATALVVKYGRDLPDYKKLAAYSPPVATRLYAADGSLLIEYAEERRVFIEFEDMPPQLVNAFVAAEDKNFWRHAGIDVFGIARAATNNLIKILGGPTRFSGASTVTQQVAKNFFLSSDRTIARKAKEAILALRLERAFSKQHIMTLYLNQIFLGARAYGVGSASLMYFNKPVAELSLSQMAFLASLPKAPNNRDRAVERRNYVLRRMMDEGFITKQQMTEAMSDPLNINRGFMAQMEDDFQYFAEDVRRELLNKIGREMLYNDGLYVKTTIVPELQRAAAAALKSAIDTYSQGREERLQGAIIVVNPHTGRVLAMSGGDSFAESSFNRATQAMRQVGSTIKPFVYLAALETGNYTPQTLLMDAPIVGWREDEKLWKPENYDRKFLGNVPFRLSLETSRNVPTVRLVDDIGVRRAVATAQRFGVYDNNMRHMNLSLALGSGETTLAKLALGYAAFINGGYRHDLKLVDYVQDRHGKIIGTRNQESAGDMSMEWTPGMLPPERVEPGEALADPQSLYQIVSILQGAVEMGTGRQARVPGRTIAGKTGTTNEVRDVWFVGFSKDLVAGVYLGYDNPHPLGPGAGSYMAAKVFGDFMKVALQNESNRPFPIPDGLELIRVNRATGIAASQDPEGTIILEAFKPGQKPNPPRGAPNEDGASGETVVGGVF